MAEGGEVDLTEVERIKIDRTFERLQRLDYYEILNLPRQATKAQIKKNYYAVSKEFHPDRYFRRTLGEYKDKLETIFDLLAKAYNTLYHEEDRSEYDRDLIEASFRRGPAIHEITVERLSPPVPPVQSSGPAPYFTATRPATPAAPAPKPLPEPQKPADLGPRPVFMDRFQNQLMERLVKSREYFRIGKECMDRGNFAQAQVNLQMATTYDSRNAEAKELLERATDLQNETKAETFYNRAQQELMLGNEDVGRLFLKRAVDCKPKKGYYYFKLASLLMTSEHERRQGLEYLKMAAQYDPDNVEYLMSLAHAYEELQMPRNAIREYDKILSLDRGNSAVVKALKRLRAGF